MHMKAHSAQDRFDGPFCTQVVISLWQCGQIMRMGSSDKSLISAKSLPIVVGDVEGWMIGSFKEHKSKIKIKLIVVEIWVFYPSSKLRHC